MGNGECAGALVAGGRGAGRSGEGGLLYSSPFASGPAHGSLQKVGEEAVEVVVAALAQDKAALSGEAADLLYHLWVLLKGMGLSPQQVEAVLRDRHGKK